DTDARALDDALDAPPAFKEQLAPVLAAYQALRAALASDDLEAARGAATSLGVATRAVPVSTSSATNAAWDAMAAHFRAHADQAAAATDLAAARDAFFSLSQQAER